MIEKKIHYIWMGRGEKSDLINACISSWKHNLKGFEIIEWNEDNFDINSISYVKQAYKEKKWAFVSDYVRLYALYNHGGIYMDTDMEIVRPIDEFLAHRAFSGFESEEHIPTGIMGAEKGHPWIKDLMDEYAGKSFYFENGKLDLTPNVVSITEITKKKYGLILKNSHQVLKEDLNIYPKVYFCPSNFGDSPKQVKKSIKEQTYTIHHYDGSWLNEWGKLKISIKKIVGPSGIKAIKKIAKVKK